MVTRSVHRIDTPHRLTELRTADEALHYITKIGGLTRARIHPEAAQALLELNRKNRKVRPSWVLELTRRLTIDHWELTTDAIGIDSNGDISNGQHRLLASVSADKPIDVLLVTNLAPTARHATDTGVKRTIGDMLQLDGYEYAHTLASAVPLYRRYLEHVGEPWPTAASHNQKRDYVEILEYLDEHPLFGKVASFASTTYHRLGHGGISQTTFEAAITMCAELSVAETERFYEGLGTGVDLPAGDPRLALRRYHVRIQQRPAYGSNAPRGGYEPQEAQLLNVIRMWNAWRRDKTVENTHVKRNTLIVAPR